jgi:hypothetical protein
MLVEESATRFAGALRQEQGISITYGPDGSGE